MNLTKVDYSNAENIIIEEYISSELSDKSPQTIAFFGQPGVGKTFCVNSAAKKIAKRNNYEMVYFQDLISKSKESQERFINKIIKEGKTPFFFVDISMQTHEPYDLSGIPEKVRFNIDGEQYEVSKFFPPSWVVLLQKYPGILFIDEITNIQNKEMQSILLKIAQQGLIGDNKMSDKAMVIVAGNRIEDSDLATSLPIPLINRMEMYEFIPPKADDWYQYIKNKHAENFDEMDFDEYAAAYLAIVASKPELPSEEEQNPFATPRSCEMLYNKIIKQQMLQKNGIINEMKFYENISKAAPALIGYKEGGLFAQTYKNMKDYYGKLCNGLSENDLKEIKSLGTYYSLSAMAGKIFKTAIKGEVFGISHDIMPNMKKNLDILFTRQPETISVFLHETEVFIKGSHFNESLKALAYIKTLIESREGITLREIKENAEKMILSTLEKFEEVSGDKALYEKFIQETNMGKNLETIPVFAKSENLIYERIRKISIAIFSKALNEGYIFKSGVSERM